MFGSLFRKRTLDLRIAEHRIQIRYLEDDSEYDHAPLVAIILASADKPGKGGHTLVAVGDDVRAVADSSNPEISVINLFSHPRTLLADFVIAEVLGKYAILQLTGLRAPPKRLRVVMHPLEKSMVA